VVEAWLEGQTYKKFELMLTRRAKVWQFLFANCLQLCPHFVTIYSWSVRRRRRSQKSIKSLILGVQGLSKPSMFIRLMGCLHDPANVQQIYSKYTR